jgi:hypothetical protein
MPMQGDGLLARLVGRLPHRPRRWVRLLFRIAGLPMVPFVAILEAISLAAQRTRVLRGIRVGMFHSQESGRLCRVVDTALEIIEAWDPGRFQSIQHDVRRIAMVPTRTSHFSDITRVCYVSERPVAESGAVNVAAAIVHEGVHARLRRRGLGAWGLDLRARAEQLCIGEEIAFLRLLPPHVFIGIEALVRHTEERKQAHAAEYGI